MKFEIYDAQHRLMTDKTVQSRLEIDEELLSQAGAMLHITTQVPIIDLHGVWQPGMSRCEMMRLPWVLNFTCGANLGVPFVTFFNLDGDNRCSVGLTDLWDDCNVCAKLNQQQGCYQLSFAISIDPATRPFTLFCSCEAKPWRQMFADFRSLIVPETPSYPEGAWLPVYCTWYAVHGSLNETYLRENASLAAMMGFGTFLVDDGWSYPEMKRVTPETLPDWYDTIGDWDVSHDKLPHMREIIREAQDLGLRYLLWTAPFFAGVKSKFSKLVGENNFLTAFHEGQRLWDIADPALAKNMYNQMVKLFEDYQLDGLKIDFIDAIEPDAGRPRARAIYAFLEKLVGELRRRKPDALIEFRQSYATVATMTLATAFRAGDVPFDFLDNFYRLVQLRLNLGDRVPVHADPIYFHQDELDRNVERHMIAALLGVPIVSNDLRQLKPSHRAIIEKYLAVYRANQPLLNYGHWEFDFVLNLPVCARVSENSRCIAIILGDSFDIEKLKKEYSDLTVFHL